jgi:hypothetical protein
MNLSYEQTRAILKRLRESKPSHKKRGKLPRLIEIDGESRTVEEWAKLSQEKYGDKGATPNLIYYRLFQGKTGWVLIAPIK